MVETIKDELSNVYASTKAFCNSKQLDINLAKTQFIMFKSPSKKLAEGLELVLDSQTFPVLQQVKLLGVTLDRHLTYKEHVASTVNTCNGYLGVLRRIACSLPRELCTLFYSSIIRSHLEFAGGLLVPVAKTHLEKLDIIQRKAARIICQTSSDSHAEPLLASLGLQSLHERRSKHMVKLVSDVLSNNCHPGLENMFNWEDADGADLQLPVSNTLMGKKRFGYVGAEVFNRYLND